MSNVSKPVGFVGLGTMGEPMARRLAEAGVQMVVWNRSPDKCEALARLGAAVASDPAELFARCEIIVLMLVDGAAMDAVLARGAAEFASRVRGRLLVNMATTSPAYSAALAADIGAAGGSYVEAPVSGSRQPAEAGQLVGMIAGDARHLEAVRPLLAPMCREVVSCGPVPNALRMKLAVNLFLTTLVTGLAEATHFASRHGLDLDSFRSILDAGPLASTVSRMKLAKLLAHDFSVQASINNVNENVRLIFGAAREVEMASPLLDVCHALFSEARSQGLGDADMIGVIRAIEHRTVAARGAERPATA